jgi:hypothetical protein
MAYKRVKAPDNLLSIFQQARGTGNHAENSDLRINNVFVLHITELCVRAKST